MRKFRDENFFQGMRKRPVPDIMEQNGNRYSFFFFKCYLHPFGLEGFLGGFFNRPDFDVRPHDARGIKDLPRVTNHR